MWTEIAARIRQATGTEFTPTEPQAVGGGCINQGYHWRDRGAPELPSYFVKLNHANLVQMFAAEAAGLQQMVQTATLRIPQPICWGSVGDKSYLVLEWLELGGGDRSGWSAMGRQLAAMHRSTSSQGFGWQQDNTIGSTRQQNRWMPDWGEFWQQQRLGYQFQLALRRGGTFSRHPQLLAAIPTILAGHRPQPSLVHGDLWSGNAALTQTGEPVIFDPATYYGDREVDLAMTELFGGFPREFYQSYQQAWPLSPGYETRKLLYNLYHILNHFNLFGGGYANQANRMIDQLLSSLG